MKKILLLAAALACSSAMAQDSSAFDLLLDRLIKLEQRVIELEQNSNQQTKSVQSTSSTNLPSDVAAWRRNVHLGMTKSQIRAIYGEPVKRGVSGSSEWWSFKPNAASQFSPPSVTFYNGKVTSHDEPD